MQRYRVTSPLRFIVVASLLGPLSGAIIVIILLNLVYLFQVQPPTDGLHQLSDLASNPWRMMSRFGPPAIVFIGFIPALISAVLIVLMARVRPIAFVEAVVITAVVALVVIYLHAPSYFRDTTWIVLVPFVPAAIATWLIARRAGLVASFP